MTMYFYRFSHDGNCMHHMMVLTVYVPLPVPKETDSMKKDISIISESLSEPETDSEEERLAVCIQGWACIPSP